MLFGMEREYPPDFFDGVEVPPLVVTVDGDLPGRHRGSVHVEGASVVLGGELQGSLWLWAGADAEIRGGHQGSLHLEEGSRGAITGRQQGSSQVGTGCALEVTGKAQGSMHIDHGGRAVIERRGSHQGSVHNWGEYVLRGTRGGSYEGSGTYTEEPGCVVKQPTIRDGMTIYEW